MNLDVYFNKDWLIVGCLCLAANISGREQAQQFLTAIYRNEEVMTYDCHWTCLKSMGSW